MFLINSPSGSLAAAHLKSGQALLRTYGRCFAEFLNEGSLVHLRLLASPTCVGLRYGYYSLSPRRFSWQFRHLNWLNLAISPLNNLLKLIDPDLPGSLLEAINAHTINALKL